MPVRPDDWAPGGPLTATRLTTGYADRPLGTGCTRPRLGWIATAPGHNATQSAYQVKVTQAGTVGWDTGKIPSAGIFAEYDGPALAPRTRYHWSVRLWDGLDRPGPWSEPTWFETGLLDEGFGPAGWIGAEVDRAPLLRRVFTLDGTVARARLFVSGLGYANLRLNGEPVGDAVLDPGFTNYDRTVLSVTHDVTDQLTTGENVLGAELGRGFFGMTTPNVWRWHQAPWTADPRLIARLVVEYADGRTTEVHTDPAWRVTGGPTVSDSLYAGETYDARLEQPGWDRPGFDDTGWAAAVEVAAPRGKLTAQEHEPIRVVEEVAPAGITTPRPGTWVVDFGRTTAGWVRLRTSAPAGTVVRLTYGETVADGFVVAENPHVEGDRFQVDEYIAAGNGTEEWEPRFSYKGFRYVQVDGAEAELTLRVAHSDVPDTARFFADQPMYEWLEQAMRRTVRNNLHGIPTDTPAFEKNGWTGDAQVAAPTMAATLGMVRLLTKWLADLRDSQLESGQLPVIVPSGGWGYTELSPATEWSTVYPFLLGELHRWYGDLRIVRNHWQPVIRYLDWELDRLEEGLSLSVLGDWLPPGHPAGPPPEDRRLTGSVYLHRALLVTAELGELIGEANEAVRLRKAADELRDAINRTFLDRAAGVYRASPDEYRQTANAIPLAFGLVPADLVQQVADNLATDIQARGDHLDTGCLGVSVLLPVLTDHGYADLATRVALQRTYPSWGYWFELGADTMWEMWEADSRSRNHYFQGTVVQWLLENVAGVRNGGAGWERVVVRPDARDQVGSAELRTDTVRGRVVASWKRTGRVFSLEVQIPVGTTAEIHVPSATPAEVTAVPAPYAGEPVHADGYTTYTVGAGFWYFTSRSG